MGGKQPKPEPPKEEKTPKELIKQHTRSINKLRREFQKEIQVLQMNNNKIKTDIQNMIKKKEPKNNIKIIASAMLRNNTFIQRYQRLDVQLNQMIFTLQTTSTTTVLVDVMKDMNKILGKINNSVDTQNIQQVIEEFSTQVDQANILQDEMSMMMGEGEQVIEDHEVDKYIQDIEQSMQSGNGGNGGQAQVIQNQGLDADIKQLEDKLNQVK